MECEEYLSVLNDEQREAVVHQGSPLLILAGAGSGKTRVITTKIAYLISELGYSPSSILAVTFTKKAALEMKERAIALEPRSSFSQIRTFHSFGAYFLRLYAEESGMGLSSDFTVYDDEDMASLISKAVPALTKKDAAHFAKKISLAKDYCLLPDDPEVYTIESDPFFVDVYKLYEERLRKTGNVDFGDLIMLPYLILKNNQEIRQSFHKRYKVIMVDEYQDSNVAQYKLLQELSGVNENSGTYVCVVGDDDQSIYKFRGAEIQNILNFQKQFPGTKIIRLETNYRSTSEILECAESMISHNDGRLGKKLVSSRGSGKKPALVFLPDQDDETEFCYSLIEQAHENGVPYSDWAVLYRTNAQSLGFETEFLHAKVPYQVVGALKFYEREEIKDAIAWLSFIVNPRDEISWRRIINKPARGIGNTTQDKIIEAALGQSLVDGSSSVKLSKKAKEGIDSFNLIVTKLSSMLKTETMSISENLAQKAMSSDSDEEPEEKLSIFVDTLVKQSGLEEFHKNQDDNTGTQKLANLEELVNSAFLYPCTKQGLIDFLDHINLDRTVETESSIEDDTDKVTLITIHNTKGLEYPRVIITGMESGIFPREGKSQEEIEEERRIFYVGITRAKDELYLTSCGVRRLYGKTNPMMPSMFLKEINRDAIKILGTKPEVFNSPSDPIKEKYSAGKKIYHDDYGYGVISYGKYVDDEYVISVKFETGAEMKFIPKYQGKSLLFVDR